MRHDHITQGSDAWQELRRIYITGTTLGQIMGTPAARKKAYYEIIAELLTVPEEDKPEWENAMQRGTRLEPQARAAYEFHTGKRVSQTGFVTHDSLPLVAQSPDGDVLHADGTMTGVEIKCMGGENHMKCIIENEIPKEYKPQILQYFIADPNRVDVDFVAYNPEIPRFSIHIINIKREELFAEIQEATQAQSVFVSEVMDKLEELINKNNVQ
jgi:putative phage-type endonuclease